MRLLFVFVFLLGLVSCGEEVKNGEVKECIEPGWCTVYFYKNDAKLWSKRYENNKLIMATFFDKQNRVKEEINYDEKGDTIGHYFCGTDFDYKRVSNNLGEYYSIYVEFKNRDDISEINFKYDNDGQLIFKKSGCYIRVNGKFKRCDCPTKNIDKRIRKIINDFNFAKQRDSADENFLGKP